MIYDVIVAGGGPAGLMAAIIAGQAGARVLLVEKMRDLGLKLKITGKGRCNLTNGAPLEKIIQQYHNGKFLYGALTRFTNRDLQAFFQERGLALKTERGNRVFPASDEAGDVIRVLKKELKKYTVEVKYSSPVREIIIVDGNIRGVKTADTVWYGRKVIIATGGASYPGTGSTGDGYELARQAGHHIVPIRPALVPLESDDSWVFKLQGLTLKNVMVSVYVNEKKTSCEFGEMLFTHFGLSGPVILTLSYDIIQLLEEKKNRVEISIDLKPALSAEQLDHRILRDFNIQLNKQIKNSLFELLPKKIIPIIIELANIPPEKPVNSVTKEERRRLIKLLKDLRIHITKPRPIAEAIVTAGGIDIKEINPRTMESKLVKGLYFAGEIIDYHGRTGGYNLQGAFSTGYLAGISAGKKEAY